MQTPEKSKVVKEIEESYEYQVIQAAIEEVTKVIITIQDGMNSEFSQIQTLNKILDSQIKMLRQLAGDNVVAISSIKGLKEEYAVCLSALRHKAGVIKTLNRYLNERTQYLNLLYRKRAEIIKKLSPGEIIEFKGKNE